MIAELGHFALVLALGEDGFEPPVKKVPHVTLGLVKPAAGRDRAELLLRRTQELLPLNVKLHKAVIYNRR